MTGCTQTIPVPPTPIAEVAEACARAIAAGGLIVLPTDTVYGLACAPRDPSAITRIYAAKGRPAELALPVLVASPEDAPALLASPPSQAALALFERFWPGPLTVVLPHAAALPEALTAGRPTIGLRMPASDLACAIIAACGGALATTSANLSGMPPARVPAELPAELLAHVAVVVNAGACPGGVASTVVDLSAEPPRILRPGPVTAEELRTVLPGIVPP